MSEFKFACPVCGQHMMCDASQSGSVMECPTCFQKITAPQAPAAADQKFILTGTKVSDKKISPPAFDTASRTDGGQKKFPAIALILLVLVVAAGAAGFAFRGKIFKSPAAINQPRASDANPQTAGVTKADKPAVIAPPANDANWMLTLGTNALPDSPAAGRVHGQDFICERATFQSGSLTLRAGTRGPFELGMAVNFQGAQPEALSGQTINVTTNAEKAARVTLRWKDATGTVQKENLDGGYALRLEFGALANNHLPGKVYLVTPDTEKSYVMGTFNADARKPRPKAPPKK